MTILVTGGAGYIGSHFVKQLLETKYKAKIVVVDNLSTGYMTTIKTLKLLGDFDFVNLNLKEFIEVEKLFKKYKFDSIVHFAAYTQVGESIINPIKYYMNNTVNTANLVKCASQYGVKKFIFSSTAAVYGEVNLQKGRTISEDTLTIPINPYGNSKLMSEQIIIDESKTNKELKYLIFRYFNVAGADVNYNNSILSPRIGESHEPETHLIPLIAKTALNKRSAIHIYGEDYDTPDGTCIRDYIHVDDLVNVHLKGLDYLDNNESDIFNIGYGKGYSIKEVISTVNQIMNKEINIKKDLRREGDPSILVANSSKLFSSMKWVPKYNNLKIICETTLCWEKL